MAADIKEDLRAAPSGSAAPEVEFPTPLLAPGHFRLDTFSDSEAKSFTYYSAGYPGDLSNGQMMYAIHGANPLVYSTDFDFTQPGTFDTYGGQSGSPVWIYGGGDPFVVGIHVGAGTVSGTNYETRITATVLSQLVGWAAADNVLGDVQLTGTTGPDNARASADRRRYGRMRLRSHDAHELQEAAKLVLKSSAHDLSRFAVGDDVGHRHLAITTYSKLCWRIAVAEHVMRGY